jgi:porphobilinogen synthase
MKTRDLIYPLFVKPGKGIRERVYSMPGVFRFSADMLVREADKLLKSGITKVLLFGVPDKKDKFGATAHKRDSVVSLAIKALKHSMPGITVMTDVCLCAYTLHGHCGILKGPGQKIDNKKTLEALAKIALSHAEAGADYVAPSAMTKGQVRAIRTALDKSGLNGTKIMGYSAKFVSNFYGPFRDAARSSPKFGDRRAYQLDHKDILKAMKAIEADIDEGADIVMVKPALSYLDIIKDASRRFDHTLAAYNVSGEYSMVKAGAQLGYWDEEKIVLEIMDSIKRAGADMIITYHAKDIAGWLKRS